MTVGAAALRRTDTLPTSVRISRIVIAFLADPEDFS